MSADKCPVCGCADLYPFNECPCHKGTTGLSCGHGVDGVGCENAERLAIERAAEIERLREEGAKDLAGMRDMQAKFIKSDHERRDLAAEIERLKAALAKSVELWPAALVRADELADEVERLKAQLKTMADFFSEYTYLSECDQSDVDGEAERLIASARETLTETKPQETT